ncbi:MAG: SIMPL domain-containing protein [Anaerolineales bacterium]|nr:SIMPL domain-containing protein [Anaerolineales bacterium]
MKKQFVYLGVLALVALLLAACAPATTVVPVPSGDNPGGLTTTGIVYVSLPPDVAYVTIGVHSQGPDVTAAVAENEAKIAAVTRALTAMGVNADDVQTSNFSLYSGEDLDFVTGESRGLIYNVDNNMSVTVRDLDELGALLGAAIDAGANSIWGVTFDVSDSYAAVSQANDQAFQQAHSKASALANYAGVTLGEIISINSTTGGNQFGPYFGMGGGAAAESSVSISPGSVTIAVQVTVTYAISQ